ncbi:substrate-binding periplasmic protein [Thalassotalea castellviae]|uniref:ABC transporter substrate-binding protein n=1 Tax=Thalassotalea castellviae TaxID=3075612 RepID=A0ABU2ZZ09_9GAMM|nr:ABC transporter substrate-binding protein [Thalassotalea sp. W431]MDT0603161.1 ABC transporter substrate-binding protein [Thalassotalea sp. W431]
MFRYALNLIKYISFLCFTLSSEAKEVKVVTEYLAPYQVNNADNSLGGLSTEIVQAIFKQANKTPNIIALPWARAYETASSEKNVMIYSIAQTKERLERFHWIGSLINEKLYFWGLKSQFPEAIDDLNQLKKFIVASARHSNVAHYLKRNNFKHNYKLVKEDQNILMLFKGRAELIIATELTLKHNAKKLNLAFDELIKIKEFTDLNSDLNLAMNLQSDPKLVAEFQRAYTEIKAQGVINAIYKKWGITEL